ncbi:MAG: metalloregulator ArsR/SmtB family transcription factor [Gordonia sp. (in: high G+C Gram-positive bacteria)]|uniref:ArsR/SmtB family transcription factor n=1 Tax=Gordonia sp. (in: high G+C Gram-positive bacteria) TaxID=84139 RepID=UPI0039E67DC4
MGHRLPDDDAPAPLDAATADRVATTLQALAAPSRLMILSQLKARSMPVGELAAAVSMEPSAVSHQLRLLRNLGLVAGDREGRSIVYSLYDDHVAQLLDEAVYHSEHLRLGLGRRPAAAEQPDTR